MGLPILFHCQEEEAMKSVKYRRTGRTRRDLPGISPRGRRPPPRADGKKTVVQETPAVSAPASGRTRGTGGNPFMRESG